MLRTLRATRLDLRRQKRGSRADEALAAAIKAIRALEIPHLEDEEDFTSEGHTIH